MTTSPPDRRRRVGAVALTAAIITAMLALASPSSATPDDPAAHTASTWLAAQLVDGRYANPFSGNADYGLMIDAVFAMYASGDGALAQPILEVLDDDGEAENFFTYAGFLGPDGADDRQGGQTAKTLVAAYVGERDPRAFGGYDLVQETLDLVITTGPEAGRITDLGPNISGNNTNTFGQALAVIGLAAADELDAPVVDQLLRQQCSEGYFRIFYYYDPSPPNAPNSCDTGKPFDQSSPDRDSTGFALSALLAARESGHPGLDGPIERATAWLLAQQTPGGGWGGGVMTEAPNTNSTGLVVQGLADAGADDAAIDRGRDFVRSAQANAADDSQNALATDIGSIAYAPDEYVTARTAGIEDFQLDRWIRATAQAGLGLSQVGFWDLVTHQVDPPATTTTTTSTSTTTSTTAAPTTSIAPTVTTGQAPSDVGAVEGQPVPAGTLPATGSTSTPLVIAASVLLVVGVALVASSHRRPTSSRADDRSRAQR